MNNGFGWNRLPKSFMGENTVFLLLTALIRNFYKFIMARLDVKRFGLKATSRIKAFVFKFISVPAKWGRTSRQYVLNIYSCNNAYADVFRMTLDNTDNLWSDFAYCLKVAWWGKGRFICLYGDIRCTVPPFY